MNRMNGKKLMSMWSIEGYNGKIKRDMKENKIILRRCEWSVDVDWKRKKKF